MGDPAANGNAAYLTEQIPLFLCPSDDGPAYVTTSGSYGISNTTTLKCPRINYGFSCLPVYDYYWSMDYWANYMNVHYPTYRAMFGNNSNCKVADIRDGTSNTAAIVETTRRWWSGNGLSWGYTGHVMCGIPLYSRLGNYPLANCPQCTSPINCWLYSTYPASSAIVGRAAVWTGRRPACTRQAARR